MAVSTRERRPRGREPQQKRAGTTGKTDAISRDEDARKLQMEALALHEDVKVLKDQVSRKGRAACDLAKKYDKMRIALDEAQATARTQEARLKRQDSEMANLRAEVQALNASAQGSTKALQEKVALARELDRLQPEMDQLKAQLANHQAVVAEKNDLGRQVDSLKVELENEKRLRQRLQSKEDNSGRTALKCRPEKAEWKLVADANQRDDVEKECERKAVEEQVVHQRLQARIDTIQTRYRAVQDELKEARSRLEKCQDELARSRSQTKGVATEPGLICKQRAQEMSYGDITVQMPGNEGMAGRRFLSKKRTAERAAVGEKSTFSITPFLQRTKDVTDASLEAEPGDAGPDATLAVKEADSDTVGERDTREPVAPTVAIGEGALELEPRTKAAPRAATAARQRDRPRRQGLTVASSAEVNRAVRKEDDAPGPKSQAAAALEVVAEAAVAEQQQRDVAADASRQSAAVLEPEAKRRTRKLFRSANRTLVADEEDELSVIRGAPGTNLARANKVRTRVGGGGGGRRSVFASTAFSPLKRDRRGMNASFLV